MGAPKALTPAQARQTLAHRLGSRVGDRLRQLNTRFGIRPYRVFLVWERYTGPERGEGEPVVVRRTELLPTPKVADLSAVALNPYMAGVLPVGSVRVSEVSVTFTQDQLTGRVEPVAHEDHIPEPYDFYYEIVEDGRGDPRPQRAKYRLAAAPFRDAGRVQWTVLLERAGEDNRRDGTSRMGDG